MPDKLTQHEVDSKSDPSVAKQLDEHTPKQQQLDDFYQLADKLKFCLLATQRPDLGTVSRCMAVSKRDGPDFLFLANVHSRKFDDLRHSKEVNISFLDSSSRDWASVTGTATTVDNKDPRIKELYNSGVSAWFGDLGDGVHNGTADDPRMALIEIESRYITYYKTQVGSVGFVKEVAGAALTGRVANTGVIRQLTNEELKNFRNLQRQK